MLIDNVLYFSPKCTFSKLEEYLESNNKSQIIEAIKFRIEKYYFNPISFLLSDLSNQNNETAFAAGTMCFILIDNLVHYENGGNTRGKNEKKYSEWMDKHFSNIQDNLTTKILYRCFRRRLAHQGCIKGYHQFSFDISTLIQKETDSKGNTIIIINPRILLQEINEIFFEYLEDVDKDEMLYINLKQAIREDIYSILQE